MIRLEDSASSTYPFPNFKMKRPNIPYIFAFQSNSKQTILIVRLCTVSTPKYRCAFGCCCCCCYTRLNCSRLYFKRVLVCLYDSVCVYVCVLEASVCLCVLSVCVSDSQLLNWKCFMLNSPKHKCSSTQFRIAFSLFGFNHLFLLVCDSQFLCICRYIIFFLSENHHIEMKK